MLPRTVPSEDFTPDNQCSTGPDTSGVLASSVYRFNKISHEKVGTYVIALIAPLIAKKIKMIDVDSALSRGVSGLTCQVVGGVLCVYMCAHRA